MIITAFLTALSYVVPHWRRFAIGLGVFVLIIGSLLIYRGCSKPIKIDQGSIDKINSNNRREREKELQKVIEDNETVIRTVDERTAIAETNVVERDHKIAEKIKEADKKIIEAKERGEDITSEALECLLIPQNCK